MGIQRAVRSSLWCFILVPVLVLSVQGKLFMYEETLGSPCILVDVDFTITMRAYAEVEEVGKAERSQDDVVQASGSCGEANAVLNLIFANGTNWGLIFRKTPAEEVELDRVLQMTPKDVFGDAVNDSVVTTFNDPASIDLGAASFSYKCNKLDTTVYRNTTSTPGEFSYVVEISVTNIQAQAFNVEGGQFSPALPCEGEDNSTTTTSGSTTARDTTVSTGTTDDSNTTSAVTETTSVVTETTSGPPTPPVNNYTVKDGNITCIFVQAAFSVDIKYEANVTGKVMTNTAHVDIPKTAEAEGLCNTSTSTQILQISFKQGWLLELEFGHNSDQMDLMFADSEVLETSSYGIVNVTLKYVVDEETFPDSVLADGTEVVVSPDSSEPDFPRKASDKDYYKCNSQIEMKLMDDVTVDARDLRFKAFNQNNDTSFTGGASECSHDEDTDSHIPIAVGCSLGAVFLIVLTIFAVNSYRKKRKFQSYQNI